MAAQALDAAIDAGIAQVPAGSVDRERVRAMLQDPNMRQGIEEMKNMTASIGLPGTRVLLLQLIELGNATAEEKQDLRQAVEQLSPIKEHGSLELKFIDVNTNKKAHVYLRLDECDEDYNLGSTIDGLLHRMGQQRKPELLKHISTLINLGRVVYGTVTSQQQPLMAQIASHLPDATAENISALKVDQEKTMLFPHPLCAKRLCVISEDVVNEGDENAGDGASGKKGKKGKKKDQHRDKGQG